MLQVLDVEDNMVCLQVAIFSTLRLRNFYEKLRSRLLQTIMESGFKVLGKNCHLAVRSVMFVSLIRTGRPGVLCRLNAHHHEAKLRRFLVVLHFSEGH